MNKRKLSSDTYKMTYKIIKLYLIISLPLILLLSSFYYWMHNEQYAVYQASALGVYELYDSKEGLDFEYHTLMEYLKSGRGVIESEFYDFREKAHLYDVKQLMLGAKMLLIVLAILWAASASFTRNLPKTLLKAGIFGLAVFIISLLLLNNFDSSFIGFHEALFEKGTWTFDPNTSNLKTMFPDAFFYNISENIFVTFGALNVLVCIIALVSMGLSRRSYKTESRHRIARRKQHSR